MYQVRHICCGKLRLTMFCRDVFELSGMGKIQNYRQSKLYPIAMSVSSSIAGESNPPCRFSVILQHFVTTITRWQRDVR